MSGEQQTERSETAIAANGRVDRNVMRPAACPFCGCEMTIRSNRDWHHLEGDHDDYCVFVEGDPTMTGPATLEQLAVMIRDWNRRHNVGGKGRCAAVYRAASSDRRERP